MSKKRNLSVFVLTVSPKAFVINLEAFTRQFCKGKTLSPKVYYLKNCVEFGEIWTVSPGFLDEQSIEAVHQVYK